jgi:hypothetical protein
VECKLRSINFRIEQGPRRAFWLAISVTGIADDWYRSLKGVVVKSFGAPGTAIQPMRKSQTNSERCEVLVNVHSIDSRH